MQCSRSWCNFWVGKILWRRDRLPTPVFVGFPGGSDGKESTCNVETWFRSLDWEDLLEKWTATHSSFLSWRIPSTEEPGKLQSTRSQSQIHLSDFHTHTHTHKKKALGKRTDVPHSRRFLSVLCEFIFKLLPQMTKKKYSKEYMWLLKWQRNFSFFESDLLLWLDGSSLASVQYVFFQILISF